MFKKSLLVCVMLLAVIVPTSAFAQSPVEDDAQSLLSAFMSYADLRIRTVQQSLEILAATAEAKSGKWESMRGLLELYEKADGKMAVWYVLPDGTYYTVDKGLMDVTLSDRSYFADLMAGRKRYRLSRRQQEHGPAFRRNCRAHRGGGQGCRRYRRLALP